MTMDLDTLTMLFPSLLLLLGLGFIVVIDPYIKREHRKIMLLIVVLCLSLIVQNLWGKRVVHHPLQSGAEECFVRLWLFCKTCFFGFVLLFNTAKGKKMPRMGAGRDKRCALLQFSVY